MTGFTMHLQAASSEERIDGVRSFVGQDASGLFGIWPGHERLLTSLTFGLARFRTSDEDWQYLAVPKALLYCVGGDLYLTTRRYLKDHDYGRIVDALERQLVAEESALRDVKNALRRLEEQFLQRVWRLGRHEAMP
jgi:F-type H+-transporting ATPase subunit epsilon